MHRLVSAGILAVVILAALPAQGTVMIFLNDRELTERAQVVVQGTVVQQHVVPLQGRLWTDTHVRVATSYKGYLQAGQTLVVRQPGGETPTLGMQVAGAATFRLKEQVVLFARPAGSAFTVVGMALGKYSVLHDRQGKLQVKRDLKGLSFAAFEPGGRMTVDHHPAVAAASTLEALIARITSHLTTSGGGR